MFARSPALFAIFCALASAGGSRSAAISIYLKPGRAADPAVTYMKNELANLMHSAGFNLEWLDAQAGTPDVRDSQLVVLSLEGACRAPTDVVLQESIEEPLASTAVSAGRILPFSALHCDSLNRVLVRAIRSEPARRRDFLYGRAMGRLAAHELYHVLSESHRHSHEGIAKPAFSARDLLADRFEFEDAALAKLRLSGLPGATF
jgi:hypothetical protein